jgi:hypothetical protein
MYAQVTATYRLPTNELFSFDAFASQVGRSLVISGRNTEALLVAARVAPDGRSVALTFDTFLREHEWIETQLCSRCGWWCLRCDDCRCDRPPDDPCPDFCTLAGALRVAVPPCVREGLTPDGAELVVDCETHGEVGRVPAGSGEYEAAERLFGQHVATVPRVSLPEVPQQPNQLG